ncbi:thermonuclease family protein [Psychrobacillus glaciei]|nr:thermonuclease family protein [Psychrobacillus glaciei]
MGAQKEKKPSKEGLVKRNRMGKIYGALLLISFIVSLFFWLEQKNNQDQSEDEVESATITKEENINSTVAPAKQVDEDTDKENTLPISATTKLSEKKDELNSSISTVLTSAVVTRVVDGDTIKVKVNGKEETVRMILVDTPETKHPKLGVQPFGPEASSFTKNALTGEEIELEKDISERDRYGRLLRYVWIDGKLFNETLIEKGLARVAVFQPDVKYIDQFRELQQKAQKQGIGIWSIENYAQEDGYHTEDKKSATTTTSQPKPKPEEKTTSDSCNIKGNISSSGEKIFHVPGGQFYNVTEPEEMFCSKAAALAAGYRASKR